MSCTTESSKDLTPLSWDQYTLSDARSVMFSLEKNKPSINEKSSLSCQKRNLVVDIIYIIRTS